MNEQQKIEETARYFQKYRDLVQRIANVDAQHAEKQRLWDMENDSYHRRRNDLHMEMQTMRCVITKMIESDMDPTMAKLQQDESWARMSTMWQKRDGYDSYDTVVDLSDMSITGSGSISSISTVGAIGASGAMGPSYGNGYFISSAGANGPAGPITTEQE